MNLAKAKQIFSELKGNNNNFHLAGSARRGKLEDLHDLDIVFVGESIPEIPNLEITVNGAEIVRGIYMGEQVDIYRCNKENFGAMMLYLTGPRQYSIMMRAKAKYKGMKLNQLGLYDLKGNLIASETEEDIYLAMNLKYKVPELRGVKKVVELESSVI